MTPGEYEKLNAVEDQHWWFVALRANLVDVMKRCLNTSPDALLDAGCGTGALVRTLVEAFPEANCAGLDLDEGACAFARRKIGAEIYVGSVNGMPFADNSYEGIVSADVLCHAGVEVDGALREFCRVLQPGGVLALNLPAYPWLLSAHDHAVSNVRRFTRSEVLPALRRAGFVDVRATYWNTLLFPLMVLHRKVGAKTGSSDVEPASPFVDAVFGQIMKAEGRLLRWGVHLPYGGSLLATARKP